MESQYSFGKFDVSHSVFAKSNDTIAVYNIAPIVPGHVMLVPLHQVESLNELSEEQLSSFFSFGRRVTNFLVTEFNATGFDWTIQDGRSAGQTVPHLHLHIIPRHEGDFPEPGDWYPALEKSQEENIDSETRRKLTKEETETIVSHLKEKWIGFASKKF